MPPLSMDYTLLHLLVPFGLLCLLAAGQSSEGARITGLGACLVRLAFVFTAGTYFTIKWPLTCQFRALALVVLLAVVLRYPLPWSMLDDADTVTA